MVLSSGVVTPSVPRGDFSSGPGQRLAQSSAFYAQAMKLYRNRKPIVAAVEGAAIRRAGLAFVASFPRHARSTLQRQHQQLGFHPALA
ncbi:hypothetical protein ACU4GD_01465 [Cupriavidus basilensis]